MLRPTARAVLMEDVMIQMSIRKLSEIMAPLPAEEGLAYVKDKELEISGPVPIKDFIFLTRYAKRIRVINLK